MGKNNLKNRLKRYGKLAAGAGFPNPMGQVARLTEKAVALKAEWRCPKCALRNHPLASTCAHCQTPQPT